MLDLDCEEIDDLVAGIMEAANLAADLRQQLDEVPLPFGAAARLDRLMCKVGDLAGLDFLETLLDEQRRRVEEDERAAAGAIAERLDA